MKTTRQIFILKGKNEFEVRKVLRELEGFKAVTIVSNVNNHKQVINVFNNNKSIITTTLDLDTYLLQFKPIEITVTNLIYLQNSINVDMNIPRQFMEIALHYNIDIGDHVANTIEREVSKKDCVFCKLLSGNPVHKQPPIYESENFLVVPGSGSFLDGYLMILPKSHIMSCAELDEYQFEELEKVLKNMRFILQQVYEKNILIWENGSGMNGKGKPKTSIVHAHIHMCPTEMNILNSCRMSGVMLQKIKAGDINKYKKDPYLLVINFDDNWYILYDQNIYIPRQYIRQLLAMEHNVFGEFWDWRQYPFWNNGEKTAMDIKNFIRLNFKYLSKEIQESTRQFL